MCTGLELALMGAGAAGSAIQANQVQKQQDAMVSASNNRLDQFMDRNQQRSDDAAALFNERQAKAEAETAGAERDKATEVREAASTEAIDSTAPAAAAPTEGSAASVIGKVYQSESDKGRAASKARAKAMAKTSGYGDALFGQDLATTDIGRKIGTIGEFSSSDAAMLPHYQDLAMAAASARNRPGPIGAILSGLGTAGGYYYGAGKPSLKTVP